MHRWHSSPAIRRVCSTCGTHAQLDLTLDTGYIEGKVKYLKGFEVVLNSYKLERDVSVEPFVFK